MYRLSQKHDYKCHFVCKSTILSMDNVRKVLAKDNVDKSKMMYQGENVLREYGCIQNCEETTKVPSNDDIKWRNGIDDGFEENRLDGTPRA